MLVGNILSVQWPEVWLTGGIYVLIGAFHWIFRKRFLEISMDAKAVSARGISVRFWDFLFYASFGFVVTRSVAIAGVLLVFCYLIVPAVGARWWAQRIGTRLAIGWVMGILVSALGMYFSVAFDLPTGATIVCTFGLVLILIALARPLLVRRAQDDSVRRPLPVAILVSLALVLAGPYIGLVRAKIKAAVPGHFGLVINSAIAV